MKKLTPQMAPETQRHSENASSPLCVSVPPWQKSLRLGLLLLTCAFAVATAQNPPSPGPEQPIPFSHKLHAGEQRLKCATCHKNADPGERMGLATAGMCMQCHSDIKADSPAIQRLASYAAEKKPIRWVRVYEIPSYVFFSHRVHTEAGASCAECHGEVREIEKMYRVKPVTMASCMNCHQAKGASTDCNYCHEKMN